MTVPVPEDTVLPDAAALLGLDLPPECLAGVRAALVALHVHWRLVDDADDALSTSANAV